MSSSSMDQAFVKAFARRNRSVLKTNPQARSGGNRPAAGQNGPILAADSGVTPGELQVDRSVAKTAQVWIDPIEDQISRADLAAREVPKPHVEPQLPPAEPATKIPEAPIPEVPISDVLAEPPASAPTVDSLQHIHTAYSALVTEIPVLPTELADIAAAANVAPLTGNAKPVTEYPVSEEPASEEPAPQPLTNIRIDLPDTQTSASPTIVPFQPAWEVDVFDVPTSVADLFFEGVLFQQIAERMSNAVAAGLGSVLVTSTKKGEGRSSVAIGMAMASAAAGIRVALVDADTDDPTLADDLRLELQHGWADTVRGGLPIKEVAIHAVEDGVTLIPLMPPGDSNAATAFEVVQLIELLREKFELIIIDGPTGASANLHQCAAAVDSAIIVRDMTRTDTYAINEFSYRLRESGIQGVGVVENFA